MTELIDQCVTPALNSAGQELTHNCLTLNAKTYHNIHADLYSSTWLPSCVVWLGSSSSSEHFVPLCSDTLYYLVCVSRRVCLGGGGVCETLPSLAQLLPPALLPSGDRTEVVVERSPREHGPEVVEEEGVRDQGEADGIDGDPDRDAGGVRLDPAQR